MLSPVRTLLHELAARGHRVPIGTDLVLREKPDAEAILLQPDRLGRVIIEAASKYKTPLGLPLMDLTVEKHAMLTALGLPSVTVPTFHFDADSFPEAGSLATFLSDFNPEADPRMAAQAKAIGYVAANSDLLPIGMAIGPFSLMTKLLAEPITPVYVAGTGATAEEDDDVALLESVLELSLQILQKYVRLQIECGARAMIICEPAANRVFVSPKQMEQGSDVFDRYIIRPNRQLRALMAACGTELILHDCGELTVDMLRQLVTLDPAMLSLGSSRVLWEDAAMIPREIVLYGNLPTKRFYSDDLVTNADVERMVCELESRMRAVGHPFILGSECDVLSVAGAEAIICGKIDTMLTCRCH